MYLQQFLSTSRHYLLAPHLSKPDYSPPLSWEVEVPCLFPGIPFMELTLPN
jgi:hypothetical protein